MKRILIATAAVFVTWSIMDFVIHGVMLKGIYGATASLWRPEAEMKWASMYLAVLISAFAFSGIYGWLVGNKSMATAVKYGALFGLASGVSMGYGTYSVMPIPYTLAFAWFVGTLVEVVAGGAVLGLVFKSGSS